MSNATGLDNNWLLIGSEDDSVESTDLTGRGGMSMQRVPRPRPGWNQVGRELGYLIPNLPITIAGFVVAITGFWLGVGLMPLFLVGIVVLVGTLFAARGLASFERGRLGILEGRRVGPVEYREPRGSGLGRLFGCLRDGQLWKDWGFLLVSFPIRIATWSIAVAWTAAALGGVSYLLWEWSLPDDNDHHGLSYILGWDGWFADVVLTTAIGLFAALTLPYVLRGLTATESAVAWAMLTNENASLRTRTDELSRSRQAVIRAEADTLRQVERDIHDGPQQRLVRLTMDLEAVQRRLSSADPAAASEIVDGALIQTKEALNELRALSRGIAPPILTDRGLNAALGAAVARNPVDTALQFSPAVSSRLPAAVENAAYFVVTETLTNVAKHSGAQQCVVSVMQFGDIGQQGAVLQLRISDDGRGGAMVGKGHGLAGLTDRLAGVDGHLTVDSPPEMGTVITVEIPLG